MSLPEDSASRLFASRPRSPPNPNAPEALDHHALLSAVARSSRERPPTWGAQLWQEGTHRVSSPLMGYPERQGKQVPAVLQVGTTPHPLATLPGLGAYRPAAHGLQTRFRGVSGAFGRETAPVPRGAHCREEGPCYARQGHGRKAAPVSVPREGGLWRSGSRPRRPASCPDPRRDGIYSLGHAVTPRTWGFLIPHHAVRGALGSSWPRTAVWRSFPW